MKGEFFMQQGRIVTLSGISGIGKSHLKTYILANKPDFQSLISVTTRKPRGKEKHGIDKFFYSLEKFENGKTYTITAKEIYGDNELVSFECLIYNGNKEVAKAVINAFQPADAEKYITETGTSGN